MLVPGDKFTFLGNERTYYSTESASGMQFNKYMDPFRPADAIGTTVNPNGDNMTTDLSIPLIRFSEVLLWKAEALIWQGKKKSFAKIESSGPALGIMKGAEYRENRITYDAGDYLFLYTDGILEQQNSQRDMYGFSRLEKTFSSLINNGKKDILSGLFDDLAAHAGDEEQEDDVTLYLLEFTAEDTPVS